ncbi:MAG TPA: LysM peptidoglycan-binding domain-containing protein [Solirubrobacteraceae bacterium]|jgi:teichoic acid transport system ATP-binding protein
MSSHRPSRFLAPLALLASIVAVLMIVSATTGDGDSDKEGSTSTQERRATNGRKSKERTSTNARTSTTPQRKTYTVKPGDTLASISERTGVTVEEIEDLNPDIDANSLTVGDKIKLTE